MSKKKTFKIVKSMAEKPEPKVVLPEVKQPEDEKVDEYIEPEIPKGQEYWKNPVFIDGKPVSGKVTEADREAFITAVRVAMLPSQFKNWKFSKWVVDHDIEAKRKTEWAAKRKKELGLT